MDNNVDIIVNNPIYIDKINKELTTLHIYNNKTGLNLSVFDQSDGLKDVIPNL